MSANLPAGRQKVEVPRQRERDNDSTAIAVR